MDFEALKLCMDRSGCPAKPKRLSFEVISAHKLELLKSTDEVLTLVGK